VRPDLAELAEDPELLVNPPALVRARWDEAVRLGTPGLAVQAQYGTSAPILRRLGFAEVAVVHTLQR
jgi:hypothetical protein